MIAHGMRRNKPRIWGLIRFYIVVCLPTFLAIDHRYFRFWGTKVYYSWNNFSNVFNLFYLRVIYFAPYHHTIAWKPRSLQSPVSCGEVPSLGGVC